MFKANNATSRLLNSHCAYRYCFTATMRVVVSCDPFVSGPNREAKRERSSRDMRIMKWLTNGRSFTRSHAVRRENITRKKQKKQVAAAPDNTVLLLVVVVVVLQRQTIVWVSFPCPGHSDFHRACLRRKDTCKIQKRTVHTTLKRDFECIQWNRSVVLTNLIEPLPP